MRVRRFTLLVLLIVAAATGSPGCDQGGTPKPAAAADRSAGARATVDRSPSSGASRPCPSPADVVRRLQSLHAQRDYAGVAPLIAENRRASTIALLRAVDGVIDANIALREAAAQAYAGPSTETWDLAAMENNLGPFSKRVKLINQRFKGDAAVVTLQEGRNVPLVHARFEWVGSAWQYQPEPTPTGMAAELEELAQILRDVEESVRLGAPVESYLDAFVYRVLPQMARVVTAREDASDHRQASRGKASHAVAEGKAANGGRLDRP